MDEHFLHSTYREKALEHLFIGECLRRLWTLGHYEVEVLQADVDAAGYDLVMEANGHIRHIQLKSSLQSNRPQNVNAKLMDKPSGCVVWKICNPNSLEIERFYWFGGEPGLPLPDLTGFKLAKNTRGDATGEKKQRQNTYKVRPSQFQLLDGYDSLLSRLFDIQD